MILGRLEILAATLRNRASIRAQGCGRPAPHLRDAARIVLDLRADLALAQSVRDTVGSLLVGVPEDHPYRDPLDRVAGLARSDYSRLVSRARDILRDPAYLIERAYLDRRDRRGG